MLGALGTRSTLGGTSPVVTATLTPSSSLGTRALFGGRNLCSSSLLGRGRFSDGGLGGGGAGLGAGSLGWSFDGCGSVDRRLGLG